LDRTTIGFIVPEAPVPEEPSDSRKRPYEGDGDDDDRRKQRIL
jgi:hypothetical protein